MEQGPAQVAPLPLEPLSEGTSDDRRLWIGNLDPRVREGYAFVTYSSLVNTQKALRGLHGKMVGTTRISVRLAHSVPKSELEKQKPEINIPALAGGVNKEGRGSSLSKIQEIEAKLKLMQKSSDEFNLTATTHQQGSSQSMARVVPGAVLYKQQHKPMNKEKVAPYYSRHDKRRHRK